MFYLSTLLISMPLKNIRTVFKFTRVGEDISAQHRHSMDTMHIIRQKPIRLVARLAKD